MAYFSDHGEHAYAPILGHNASTFTWKMTRIPLFFSVSEQYLKRYADKFEHLRQHQDDIFTNDRIFDSFLDLADVKSELIDFKYSLCSNGYTPSQKIFAEHVIADDPKLIATNNLAQACRPVIQSDVASLFEGLDAKNQGIKGYEFLIDDFDINSATISVRNETSLDLKVLLNSLTKQDLCYFDLTKLNHQKTQTFIDYLNLHKNTVADYLIRPNLDFINEIHSSYKNVVAFDDLNNLDLNINNISNLVIQADCTAYEKALDLGKDIVLKDTNLKVEDKEFLSKLQQYPKAGLIVVKAETPYNFKEDKDK